MAFLMSPAPWRSLCCTFDITIIEYSSDRDGLHHINGNFVITVERPSSSSECGLAFGCTTTGSKGGKAGKLRVTIKGKEWVERLSQLSALLLQQK